MSSVLELTERIPRKVGESQISKYKIFKYTYILVESLKIRKSVKQTIFCCRCRKIMDAMGYIIAKMYLCIWQISFSLAVVKQLVWWVEGLFLFHSKIILFKGRRPNTCDLGFFSWTDWWQRRIWIWRSTFRLWVVLVMFALGLLPPLQTLSSERLTVQYHWAGSPVS